MVLDTDQPEMERHGDFTVAGVAHRGTGVDEAALWDSIDDYADDLDDAAVGTDYYAVMFDVDEDSGEFTYVAGREVEDTDDPSAELTAVEVPQATYAVLELGHESVEEMVRGIHEEELRDDDRDPTTVADREIYVPVRDEDDEY
jgi:predicted transcriptional regulator YdeE